MSLYCWFKFRVNHWLSDMFSIFCSFSVIRGFRAPGLIIDYQICSVFAAHFLLFEGSGFFSLGGKDKWITVFGGSLSLFGESSPTFQEKVWDLTNWGIIERIILLILQTIATVGVCVYGDFTIFSYTHSFVINFIIIDEAHFSWFFLPTNIIFS